MLLFEKNEIILKAFYQDASLIIQPYQYSKEREGYAQTLADSEESLARIYLKTNHGNLTVEDVKNHFILRGWTYVKPLFK